MREYKAMHEEDFWSSWLREDERGKEERTAKKLREKVNRGKEKRRKKKTKRGLVKERCGDLESCGDLSWKDLGGV